MVADLSMVVEITSHSKNAAKNIATETIKARFILLVKISETHYVYGMLVPVRTSFNLRRCRVNRLSLGKLSVHRQFNADFPVGSDYLHSGGGMLLISRCVSDLSLTTPTLI